MPKFRGIEVEFLHPPALATLPEYVPPVASHAARQTDPFISDTSTTNTTSSSLSKVPPLIKGKTISVFIPICPFTPFWIKFTIHTSSRERHACFLFHVFINGQFVTSCVCSSKERSTKLMTTLWSHDNTDTLEQRSLYFGLEDPPMTLELAENMVKINAYRVRSHKPTAQAPAVKFRETDLRKRGLGMLFSEYEEQREAKCDAVVEGLSTGLETPEGSMSKTTTGPKNRALLDCGIRLIKSGLIADKSTKNGYLKCTLWDSIDEPFATFQYFYRTWEQLRELGVCSSIVSSLSDSSYISPSGGNSLPGIDEGNALSSISTENTARPEKVLREPEEGLTFRQVNTTPTNAGLESKPLPPLPPPPQDSPADSDISPILNSFNKAIQRSLPPTGTAPQPVRASTRLPKTAKREAPISPISEDEDEPRIDSPTPPPGGRRQLSLRSKTCAANQKEDRLPPITTASSVRSLPQPNELRSGTKQSHLPRSSSSRNAGLTSTENWPLPAPLEVPVPLPEFKMASEDDTMFEPPPIELPSGWEQRISRGGSVYFHDTVRDFNTVFIPSKSRIPPVAKFPRGIEIHYTLEGKIYFTDKARMQSTFSLPDVPIGGVGLLPSEWTVEINNIGRVIFSNRTLVPPQSTFKKPGYRRSPRDGSPPPPVPDVPPRFHHLVRKPRPISADTTPSPQYFPSPQRHQNATYSYIEGDPANDGSPAWSTGSFINSHDPDLDSSDTSQAIRRSRRSGFCIPRPLPNSEPANHENSPSGVEDDLSVLFKTSSRSSSSSRRCISPVRKLPPRPATGRFRENISPASRGFSDDVVIDLNSAEQNESKQSSKEEKKKPDHYQGANHPSNTCSSSSGSSSSVFFANDMDNNNYYPSHQQSGGRQFRASSLARRNDDGSTERPKTVRHTSSFLRFGTGSTSRDPAAEKRAAAHGIRRLASAEPLVGSGCGEGSSGQRSHRARTVKEFFDLVSKRKG